MLFPQQGVFTRWLTETSVADYVFSGALGAHFNITIALAMIG